MDEEVESEIWTGVTRYDKKLVSYLDDEKNA